MAVAFIGDSSSCLSKYSSTSALNVASVMIAVGVAAQAMRTAAVNEQDGGIFHAAMVAGAFSISLRELRARFGRVCWVFRALRGILARAFLRPGVHHAGRIQCSSRRRGRRHAHPFRARPRRLFARRQPGHVHRGAAGAGGQIPPRGRTAGRRHRRRGAQALQGLQPGARVRVVVGARSADSRHRHAARLRHRASTPRSPSR